MAEVKKEEMGFPVLGQKAPDFEAVTTQGTLRLSDFKGTWLVLFSHPADFTPVCTTEFIAFSNIYDELKKRNVELGLERGQRFFSYRMDKKLRAEDGC